MLITAAKVADSALNSPILDSTNNLKTAFDNHLPPAQPLQPPARQNSIISSTESVFSSSTSLSSVASDPSSTGTPEKLDDSNDKEQSFLQELYDRELFVNTEKISSADLKQIREQQTIPKLYGMVYEVMTHREVYADLNLNKIAEKMESHPYKAQWDAKISTKILLPIAFSRQSYLERIDDYIDKPENKFSSDEDKNLFISYAIHKMIDKLSFVG
jgi:hypothetical protein